MTCAAAADAVASKKRRRMDFLRVDPYILWFPAIVLAASTETVMASTSSTIWK
jgi:hypothetical protein